MEIDAAGGRKFNVIDELLKLKILDERRDVEQLLHLCIVLVLDGLLKLGKLCPHGVNSVGCGEFILRKFYCRWHSIDLRIEVVIGIGTLARAVVHVQGEQDAPLIADVDAVLALLNLLCQLIDTTIFAVQIELHVASMVGEGQTKPLACLKDVRVHQIGHVTIVG